jgi:hypothetical protein
MNESSTPKQPNNIKDNNDMDHSINPNNKYYLTDPNGNQFLLNPYFNDIMTHKLQQDELMKQKLQGPPIQQQVQQPIQQVQQPITKSQPKEKSRPKLSHPGESENNILLNDMEDDNLAALNLTNDEMVELKKQLLQLQRNQKQQVTAQNDEDSDE